ncbi:unnamed protein product [Sphenostylis stenocarpa]|uniref:Uncharacterized protein n=1 Tax=Sphenostylis stenocarpa TaxID=92480 RepID=A0AA86VN70_9FABA|nr:unnamed protein product [Sphenostylis stenocarpa]
MAPKTEADLSLDKDEEIIEENAAPQHSVPCHSPNEHQKIVHDDAESSTSTPISGHSTNKREEIAHDDAATSFSISQNASMAMSGVDHFPNKPRRIAEEDAPAPWISHEQPLDPFKDLYNRSPSRNEYLEHAMFLKRTKIEEQQIPDVPLPHYEEEPPSSFGGLEEIVESAKLIQLPLKVTHANRISQEQSLDPFEDVYNRSPSRNEYLEHAMFLKKPKIEKPQIPDVPLPPYEQEPPRSFGGLEEIVESAKLKQFPLKVTHANRVSQQSLDPLKDVYNRSPSRNEYLEHAMFLKKLNIEEQQMPDVPLPPNEEEPPRSFGGLEEIVESAKRIHGRKD